MPETPERPDPSVVLGEAFAAIGVAAQAIAGIVVSLTTALKAMAELLADLPEPPVHYADDKSDSAEPAESEGSESTYFRGWMDAS